MTGILDGQHNFIRGNLPIDVKRRIIPSYSALTLRMVEIVALILENDLRGEHTESMGEPSRQVKHEMVLARELTRHPFPIGRRTFSYVNCDIQHLTAYDPDKLCLRKGRFLKVQASKHAIRGFALVVLYKTNRTYQTFKFSL